MHRSLALVALPLILLCGAPDADARPESLSKRFETDRKLGVGLALGVPSAASVKFLFTSEFAIDLGLGAYVAYRDRDGFHGHADLLWHPFVAVDGQSFAAPLYFGLGGRLLTHDDITHIGLRIPVGIGFFFNKTPLEVFLEGAFVADLSISEEGQSAVDINALIGARYYVF